MLQGSQQRNHGLSVVARHSTSRLVGSSSFGPSSAVALASYAFPIPYRAFLSLHRASERTDRLAGCHRGPCAAAIKAKLASSSLHDREAKSVCPRTYHWLSSQGITAPTPRCCSALVDAGRRPSAHALSMRRGPDGRRATSIGRVAPCVLGEERGRGRRAQAWLGADSGTSSGAGLMWCSRSALLDGGCRTVRRGCRPVDGEGVNAPLPATQQGIIIESN